MITIVIPTRNRAYTLKKVARSFFAQSLVSEIIFVIDAGADDTEALVTGVGTEFPAVKLRVIRNEERSGAPHCRNVGVNAAENDFILFCDDDQFLEPNYAEFCYRKLTIDGADIVAGRMVYMAPGDTVVQAIARFGKGLNDRPPFDPRTLTANVAARFEGDMPAPVAHNAIMTRRYLLQELPYDTYYSKGTGFREEGDVQMNAFVHGYKLLITNETHTVHLLISQ